MCDIGTEKGASAVRTRPLKIIPCDPEDRRLRQPLTTFFSAGLAVFFNRSETRKAISIA